MALNWSNDHRSLVKGNIDYGDEISQYLHFIIFTDLPELCLFLIEGIGESRTSWSSIISSGVEVAGCPVPLLPAYPSDTVGWPGLLPVIIFFFNI